VSHQRGILTPYELPTRGLQMLREAVEEERFLGPNE
jgi:hypothetical protein